MLKNDIKIWQNPSIKKPLHGIYRGVVEDRLDPLRLGRVRVRIWGVHTEEQGGNLNKVPWEELQWAEPIGPNFEGSISGQGAFCVPLQGSHVMVFFENGNMMQPRYFGTAAGFPVDVEKYSQFKDQDGFRDPNVYYPLHDHIDEHDWQRLARIDKLAETYLQLKRDNLDLAVPIAWGNDWDEQPPMFEAVYPDNNVFATHDDFKENIVIELDATAGKSRFAWWHPSKSYMEVNKDGLMTFRNTWHRWDICDGIVHTHYMEDHFKTVTESLVFLIEEDEFREILGNRWTHIDFDDWRRVEGNIYEWTVGSANRYGYGDTDSTILGNVNERITGYKLEHITGDALKWFGAGEYKNVEGEQILNVWGQRQTLIGEDDLLHVAGNKHDFAEGNYQMTSDELIVLDCPEIHLGHGRLATVGVKILNGVIYLGEIISAGTEVGEEEIPEPPAPVIPITSDDPPDPYIPEDFVPEDVPVEMPKPGC